MDTDNVVVARGRGAGDKGGKQGHLSILSTIKIKREKEPAYLHFQTERRDREGHYTKIKGQVFKETQHSLVLMCITTQWQNIPGDNGWDCKEKQMNSLLYWRFQYPSSNNYEHQQGENQKSHS